MKKTQCFKKKIIYKNKIMMFINNVKLLFIGTKHCFVVLTYEWIELTRVSN